MLSKMYLFGFNAYNFIIFIFFCQNRVFAVEPEPLHLQTKVYSETFLMSDGSQLGNIEHYAVKAMNQNARRLLEIANNESIVANIKNSTNEKILKIVYLAVAGNFVVYQGQSGGISQTCSLVINPSTGNLVPKDKSNTQNLIMEVMVIISIICLLRSWKGESK